MGTVEQRKDQSLSPPRIAKIVTPGIKIGKKLSRLLNFETLEVQSNLHKITGQKNNGQVFKWPKRVALAISVNSQKKAIIVFETGTNKPKPVIRNSSAVGQTRRLSEVKSFRYNRCLEKVSCITSNLINELLQFTY